MECYTYLRNVTDFVVFPLLLFFSPQVFSLFFSHVFPFVSLSFLPGPPSSPWTTKNLFFLKKILPPQISFFLLLWNFGGVFEGQNRAGVFTQQPDNSKHAHLRVPPLQTPPKFHEKTPKKGKKERNLWLEREKVRNFGPPTLRGSLGLGPHLLVPKTNTQKKPFFVLSRVSFLFLSPCFFVPFFFCPDVVFFCPLCHFFYFVPNVVFFVPLFFFCLGSFPNTPQTRTQLKHLHDIVTDPHARLHKSSPVFCPGHGSSLHCGTR